MSDWPASKVTTYPASVIATTEARTNVAYGLLATPDRVQNVVVPANALVLVAYQATWQESVAAAGRAAIFIGANQLKKAVYHNVNVAPVVQEADIGGAALDHLLASNGSGLVSLLSASAYTGDVTTGQIVGLHGNAGDMDATGNTGVNLAPSPPTVFVAAGTYDISVQFKASSGSVTAKNRKMWVEVHDYS